MRWFTLSLLCGLICNLTHTERVIADDAQGAPSSPIQATAAIQQMRIAPGFTVQLAASEPQVVDPVAIRFDAQGNMWVVEMRDYPNGPKPPGPPMSKIKVLQDQDGDGRFETATVFADQLLFATGLQPWRDGVVATLAGQVVFLRDTDGDHVADKREVWFRGFAEDNPQLRANHPTLALDNRMYIANGLRGGKVVSVTRPQQPPVSISGKDFRFDPLRLLPEAISGAGQFGLTFDDHGNRFFCSNRNPLTQIVLEDRFLARNGQAAIRTTVQDVAVAGAASRIYPISRAWTTSNLHAGQFTAACGATIYRGDALPQLRGNAFTCDPTGNLVHREVLTRSGASFAGKPARQGIEFLASTDEWFRPVNLENGPDGALYVVDMYRAVIEHPQWVPEELKRRPDERYGDDRGRIYRIVRNASKARPEAPTPPPSATTSLAQQTTAQLVAALTHHNLWHRETAARLLLERSDAEAIPALQRLVDHPFAPAAMRALWLLHHHQAVDVAILQRGLQHPQADVRSQAILVWDASGDALKSERAAVRKRCGDSDPQVRMTALLSLAPIQASEATDIAQAANFPTDAWLARAITIATGPHPAAVLQQLVASAQRPAQPGLLSDLAALGAAQTAPQQRLACLQAFLALPDEQQRRKLPLTQFCNVLQRRGSSWMELNSKLLPAQQTALQETFATAQQQLQNDSAELSTRLAMLELVKHTPTAADILKSLVTEDQPQQLRVAAIGALARFPAPKTWETLAQSFVRETPTIRRATVNAMLANRNRTIMLLDAIEAGTIKPGELDRSQSNRLLQHSDKTIRGRANQLFASSIPGDRQQALATYQPALKLKADPRAGQTVFRKNCATCHRVGEIGVNVAPDISDSRTRQPLQILTDILQPNRAIDNNYLSYSAITTDGRVLTGILVTETATSITLKQAENKVETLLRDEIETLKSNGVSLMPEGLEKNISPQQMADLVSFIKNWRYLDGKTPLSQPLPEK